MDLYQGSSFEAKKNHALFTPILTKNNMADRKSHSMEDCVLNSSSHIIFASLSSGKILYSSKEANDLLQAPPAIVISEPIHQDSCSDLFEKPTIQGQALSDYFSATETFQDEGVIQPTEIISLKDNDYSKWIYTCSHQKKTDENVVSVIYLQDSTEIKKEYNQISRTPISLNNVDASFSEETPEYIRSSLATKGDVLTVKITKEGKIFEIFPFNEYFLNTSRERIGGQSLMQLIDQKDHILLSRALSNCYIEGSSHFIVQWNPLHTLNQKASSHWVQCKALKSKDSKSFTISFTQLLPNPAASLGEQAWGLATTISGWTTPASISTSVFSFFGAPPAEPKVISVSVDAKM